MTLPTAIPRPNFNTDYLSFNQYVKAKNTLSLDQLPLKDYKERMDRKLPSSSWKDNFLEPLKTPAMRKKKMESMNKNQKLDYLESLRKPNLSGQPDEDQDKVKRRFSKETIKNARRETERQYKLSKR